MFPSLPSESALLQLQGRETSAEGAPLDGGSDAFALALDGALQAPSADAVIPVAGQPLITAQAYAHMIMASGLGAADAILLPAEVDQIEPDQTEVGQVEVDGAEVGEAETQQEKTTITSEPLRVDVDLGQGAAPESAMQHSLPTPVEAIALLGMLQNIPKQAVDTRIVPVEGAPKTPVVHQVPGGAGAITMRPNETAVQVRNDVRDALRSLIGAEASPPVMPELGSAAKQVIAAMTNALRDSATAVQKAPGDPSIIPVEKVPNAVVQAAPEATNRPEEKISGDRVMMPAPQVVAVTQATKVDGAPKADTPIFSSEKAPDGSKNPALAMTATMLKPGSADLSQATSKTRDAEPSRFDKAGVPNTPPMPTAPTAKSQTAAPKPAVTEVAPSPLDLATKADLPFEMVMTAGPADRASPLERVQLGALSGVAELPRGVGVQIAQAASRFADRPVELTLSPEELGRVRMTLTASDTGVSLHVTAERPETMDLLRRNIHQLEQDFRELGYSNISFQFGQQNDGKADPQAQAADADSDSPAAAGVAVPAVTLPLQPRPVAIATSGLDLRF